MGNADRDRTHFLFLNLVPRIQCILDWQTIKPEIRTRGRVKLSLLFSKLVIRNKVMRNRIAMPPMANNLATLEGEVVPGLIAHYRKRAREGVALVIVEHSYINPSGRASSNQLGIHRDALIAGLRELASSIKGQGALAAIQITHAGSSTTEATIGEKPVAPSYVPHPRKKTGPRALTRDELAIVRDDFARAAARAKRAGFDAVELHGAHGFLLNQFLSPLTNQREDEYGGSLQGRARFPLEVVQAVKRTLKENTLLMYRLGADDLMEGGLKVDSTAQFALWLQEEGVDIIDISGGMSGYTMVDAKPGYFRSHSRAIKSLVRVPVMVTGGISSARQAEDILAARDADIVGIGRALLKNFRWASEAVKSLEG